jgi:hypothetical protein
MGVVLLQLCSPSLCTLGFWPHEFFEDKNELPPNVRRGPQYDSNSKVNRGCCRRNGLHDMRRFCIFKVELLVKGAVLSSGGFQWVDLLFRDKAGRSLPQDFQTLGGRHN